MAYTFRGLGENVFKEKKQETTEDIVSYIKRIWFLHLTGIGENRQTYHTQ